jgi:hypothetical protein
MLIPDRLKPGLRDIEKLLVALNLAGAVLQGMRHEPLWLLVPAAAFSLYVVLSHRSLRRRIGERAWPSEGYARFALNTDLNFALRHLALGVVVYALADFAAYRLGF